ncbi:MAG: hypothetical protein L0Y71_06445 [Gemmataceae bacterium]|nr:hypothetical protein [Gemmataceae bacterium]
MIMLPGLTSLVALVRRALGKPGAEPFNLVNDVFVLPAVVAAFLVLTFYPDEIEIRRTIGYGIVLTALSWGFGTQWLLGRRSAGILSLAVRTPRQIAIPLGVCFGALALMEPFKLVDNIQDGKNIVAEAVSSFSSASSFVFLYLLLIVGIEMREHGCLTFFRFIGWHDIESYSWQATSKDYAMLTLAVRGNPLGLIKAVPRSSVDAVDRILRERGLQAGPDMPPIEVAAPPPSPEERSAADRLSGPAMLLMCSAFMQITGAALPVGLLTIVNADFGQPWLVWTIALVLAMISAAVGVVVFAGAVKMRGLNDYRFLPHERDRRHAAVGGRFPARFAVRHLGPAGVA